MPIKEIIAITTVIITTTALTGGPWNLERNLNQMKYSFLKELTRTDDWGNPSPWASHSRSVDKSVFSVDYAKHRSQLNVNPRK